MAIASYQTPNSYQELDFRPFELNYEAQLKELGAKNQYWMEGVNKIQSAYSKITGLNPQWTKNKEALKSFNDQAKEQIKKIASTDLGVQGNAEQVENVVAPLYDTSNPVSEAILLDDFHNKKGQALLKTIETYKTKDKGIYYSPTNEKYALEWYQDYIKKSNDPNASLEDLRKIKENVKGYTPYYDYTDEVETAITKCPENKSSIQSVGVGSNGGPTGYITETGITSKNSVGCIQSFLSSKAKNQMVIDGYVAYGLNYEAYGRNYEALGNDFKTQALEHNTYSQNEIGKLKVLLTDSKITPEQKQSINEQISQIESDINKNSDYITKVTNKDYSFLEQNYEYFAGNVYTRNKIKDYNSFNKNPENNKVINLTTDMTFLTNMKMQNDNNQKAIDRQFEAEQNRAQMANAREIAVANSKGKLKLDENGKIVSTDGSPVNEEFRYLNSVEGEEVKMTEDSFKAEYQNILKSKSDIAELQRQTLENVFQLQISPAQLPAFLTELQKDPVKMAQLRAMAPSWDQYSTMMDNINFDESLHNSQKIRIEKQIANDPALNEKVLIKTTQGNFTTNIKNIKNHIIYKSAKDYYTDSRGITHETESAVPYFIDANHKTPIRVTNSINQEYNKSNEIRNKYYNKAKTYSTQEMSTHKLNLDEDNTFRNNIYDQISGITDKDGKPMVTKLDQVRTGYTNGKDVIEVIIPTPKDEESEVLNVLGSNDRKVTYKGNGRYKIQFNNPKDFPIPIDINTSMNKKLSTIIEDINSSDIKNGTKVNLTTFNNHEIYINKGNSDLIWIKFPQGNSVSFNNVSEVIAVITNKYPKVNAR